jgi:hypothetical protein
MKCEGSRVDFGYGIYTACGMEHAVIGETLLGTERRSLCGGK